jgi:rod shape-determining protein MreD
VLLMTEWLRRRSRGSARGRSSANGWLSEPGIAAVGLGNRAILAIVMTPQAPLGLTLTQLILTIALYPIIAGVAHLALGLRRPAQGEVDAWGTGCDAALQG